MLRAELLEIIRNGEGSGIEFKRDETLPVPRTTFTNLEKAIRRLFW